MLSLLLAKKKTERTNQETTAAATETTLLRPGVSMQVLITAVCTSFPGMDLDTKLTCSMTNCSPTGMSVAGLLSRDFGSTESDQNRWTGLKMADK